MRFSLHIGMHKTATSSHQHLLTKNAAALAKRKTVSIHHLLSMIPDKPAVFAPNEARIRICDLAARGTEHLILSAEGYSRLSPQKVSHLIECLEGFPVTVVMCVRHWSSFIPSIWQQHTKRRNTLAFKTFLQNMLNQGHDRYDMRFDRILDSYTTTNFQEIRIVSYDNAIAGAGIIPAMLDALDLGGVLPEVSSDRVNTSTDAITIEKVRLFNGLLAEHFGLSPAELHNVRVSPLIRFMLFDIRDRLFSAMEDSEATLDGFAARNIETVDLPTRMFDDFAAPVEEAIGTYLVNPVEGKAFATVGDTSYRASETDYTALPQGLRNEMLAALRTVGKF